MPKIGTTTAVMLAETTTMIVALGACVAQGAGEPDGVGPTLAVEDGVGATQQADGGQNAIGCCVFGSSGGYYVQWYDNVGGQSYFWYTEEQRRVTAIQNRMCQCHGDELHFQYDQFGRLTGTADYATYYASSPPLWTARAYGRDTMFYGNGAKDSNGNYLVSYSALAVPSVTQVVEPITQTTSRSFTSTYYPISSGYGDQLQTMTEPSVDTPGNVVTTTFGRNAQGLLISLSRQGYVNGVSTTSTASATYDSRGRLQTTTGPRTDVTQKTTYGYFADTDADLYRRGQLSSITDALNHVTAFSAASGFTSYTIFGSPQSTTDPNSVVSEFNFDAQGRLTKTTLVGSPNLVTQLGYDSAGRLIKITKPLSNGATMTWDNNDNFLGMTLFASGGLQYDQTLNSYDIVSQPLGQAVQSCVTPANPCASWSTSAGIYVVLDQFKGLPDNAFQGDASHQPYESYLFQYDGSGNLVKSGTANHRVYDANYSYDYLHRPTFESHLLAGAYPSSSYGYDAADHLTSVTDPNGNLTTYAFDDFGNMRQEVSPVSGSTTYSHDPAGNLTGKTDANGAVTTITYDALDRPLALAATRGSSTDHATWAYDDPTSGHFGIGRLSSMTDPTGSTSYTYERRGLLTGEVRTILTYAYTLAYAYDNNGNRKTITYPDGKVLTYTFDYADRPYSVKNGSTTLVSVAKYQPFGPLASLSFGNGATQTLTYQPYRYKPSENKLANASGTMLADYTYAEDYDGNITQIHDAVNANYNRDLAYDDLDRLTTANSGTSLWGTATGNGYAYDAIGDMTGLQLGSGRTATFSYVGTTSKVSSVTENGTPRSVAYDSAGNETTVGSATYAYSPRNLLASGDGLSYLYDAGLMRRVTTTSTGKRFSFASPEMTTLSESAVASSGKPAIAYDYVWFGGRPVAQIDSSGTHYTFADHLGTPELQMDGSANVSWQAEYEPYGKVWALRAGDVHQPLRFPGQVAEQFDTGANGTTERSYNVYRWYRGGWGRYSQVDPLGVYGSYNYYGYVGENPTGLSDPKALWGTGLYFGANGEVGTVINYLIGKLIAGAGGTAGVGGGVFLDVRNGTLSQGGFATVGGFARTALTGVFDRGSSYPSCPSPSNWAAGGFLGAGENVFFTNADTVKDLSGPFWIRSFSIALGTRFFSGQYAIGKNDLGKTILVITLGVPIPALPAIGIGVSGSSYNTNTWTTEGGGECPCRQ